MKLFFLYIFNNLNAIIIDYIIYWERSLKKISKNNDLRKKSINLWFLTEVIYG
jgi:hypothetical protein